MKLISKGVPPPIWRGSCRKCRCMFEDTDENVRKGHVMRCPREYYEFAHRQCPECGALEGWGVVLYPIKGSQQH
jgi:hypothetical protein